MGKKKEKPTYWYDKEAAEKAVNFFERLLTHTIGDRAGEPFTLLDWQKDLVRKLYGHKKWNESLDRYVRQYREVMIFVPRGNGKSQLGAGIELAEMFLGDGAGRHIYSAGTGTRNAKIIFDRAKEMIEANKLLSSKAKCHAWSITYANNLIKYIPAKAKKEHGQLPSLVVIDDFHECDRDFYEVLKTGAYKRADGCMILICTAGYDKTSIAYEKYQYAKKVAAGEIEDDAFLPFIFELPEGADWKDETQYHKANPCLDAAIGLESLIAARTQALNSPSFENAFRMLHLNQWVEQSSRWLQMELWDENNSHPVTPETHKGKKCFAGLDIASTTDMTSLCLMFPNGKGYDVLPYFWIPGDEIIKREQRDNFPYLQYVKAGLIRTHDGNCIDPDLLCEEITEILEQYEVLDVGADSGFNPYIPQKLFNLYGVLVSRIRNNVFNMNEPTKEFERLWITSKLNCGDNPVFRWNCSNAVVRSDAQGNYMPDKAKATGRIDGVVAAIMALARAMAMNAGEFEQEIKLTDDDFKLLSF